MTSRSALGLVISLLKREIYYSRANFKSLWAPERGRNISFSRDPELATPRWDEEEGGGDVVDGDGGDKVVGGGCGGEVVDGGGDNVVVDGGGDEAVYGGGSGDRFVGGDEAADGGSGGDDEVDGGGDEGGGDDNEGGVMTMPRWWWQDDNDGSDTDDDGRDDDGDNDGTCRRWWRRCAGKSVGSWETKAINILKKQCFTAATLSEHNEMKNIDHQNDRFRYDQSGRRAYHCFRSAN